MLGLRKKIPATLAAVARARVEADLVDRRVRFNEELDRIHNEMSGLGLSDSGFRNLRIGDAFLREMQGRAAFAWQTWHTLLAAQRLLRQELADPLKAHLRRNLSEDSADLLAEWNQRHAGEPEKLERFRSIAEDWAAAEIDFAIDAFDWSRRRELRIQVGAGLLGVVLGALIRGFLGQ